MSCNRARQTDWSAVYAEASEKADQDDSAAAQELADRGFLSTTKGTVLNYKFLLLKGQTRAFTDPEDALELLKTPPPAGPDSEELGIERKTIQAIAYSVSGDFDSARDCLEEATKAAESAYQGLLPRIALAKAYLAFRQHDEAAMETYYRKGADLARNFKRPRAEVDALVGIAYVEMHHERYDEAIVDLTRALEQVHAIGYVRAEESILGKLGWSYYQTGDSDRAASFLKKAESMANTYGQKIDQARWSIDLGDIYLDQEDYADAAASYLTGKSLARESNNTANFISALHNLAQLELKRNNLIEAEAYNQQSLAAAKTYSDPDWQLACSLTTAELALRQKQFSKAARLLLQIVGHTKDSSLLWQAHSDLATAFANEGKPAAAEQEFQAGIRVVESARDAIKEEERRMSILDAWPFYDDYIHFLIHQNKPRNALQIAEFSRARTLADGLGIAGPKAAELSVQRIQSLLKNENQCVLAYWLAKDESYLWVITPSNVKSYVLKPQQEIETAIRAYNIKLLNHEGIEDSAEGQKLYEMLVRPAKNLVPKGSRIIIIPNRSLYKLNFETLVVPGKKPHYWIEDVTVETAGSMTLLANLGHRPANASKKLLLIGAPTQASTEFPQLIHAPEEMQKVAAHFPNGQEDVIPGPKATPDSYDSYKPNLYRFIHFVTHGTASQTSPLDSAIILSPEANGSFKLYARDVIKSHLNADLVTISACYGAGTRTYSGEGLVGLAWSFLRAGAHQVIAGLWEVDDRATPDLMDNLYDGLKHETAATALHNAKLKMLHSNTVYRFPYYWGSLQLYTGS